MDNFGFIGGGGGGGGGSHGYVILVVLIVLFACRILVISFLWFATD